MKRRTVKINIDDGIPFGEAVRMVETVVNMGRISAYKTAYCYATTFRGGYLVQAVKRQTMDVFYVQKDARG